MTTRLSVRRIALLGAVALAHVGGAQCAEPPKGEVARGAKVFDAWCATCHGAGIGNPGASERPGTAALRAKYNGQVPALLSERHDLTPEVITTFVRQGLTIMPFFRKTEVSEQDLRDISAYLTRNNPAR